MTCFDCWTLASFSERWDAAYCPVCNVWLEPECSCPAVAGCPFQPRPARPVMPRSDTPIYDALVDESVRRRLPPEAPAAIRDYPERGPRTAWT